MIRPFVKELEHLLREKSKLFDLKYYTRSTMFLNYLDLVYVRISTKYFFKRYIEGVTINSTAFELTKEESEYLYPFVEALILAKIEEKKLEEKKLKISKEQNALEYIKELLNK